MERTEADDWPVALERFALGVEAIRKEDPSMPVSWLAVLLHIAKHQDQRDGLSIRELSDLLGISYSSTAEIVKKLAAPGHRFQGAADLVEMRVDLADERRKLLRVAPKGRALLQRVNLMNKSRGE